MPREYTQAGVDCTKIEPFKRTMQEIGKRTLNFPDRRGVYINTEAGDVFEYRVDLVRRDKDESSTLCPGKL